MRFIRDWLKKHNFSVSPAEREYKEEQTRIAYLRYIQGELYWAIEKEDDVRWEEMTGQDWQDLKENGIPDPIILNPKAFPSVPRKYIPKSFHKPNPGSDD